MPTLPVVVQCAAMRRLRSARRGLSTAARFQSVRGTSDVFPAAGRRYAAVEHALRRSAVAHGFERVRTPIMEMEGVFTASLGGTSDVVSKEMYRFDDGGGRQVVLRPEATAGVTRALLERGYNYAAAPFHTRVERLYYHGPMFRRERPQRGRMRQFQQFGVEVVGDPSPHADVEVIASAWEAVRELELAEHCELGLNSLGDAESRARYAETLREFLWPRRDLLSEDSRARLERGSVLRVLDSTDPRDAAVLGGGGGGDGGGDEVPVLWNSLSDASREHFEAVRAALEHLAVPFTLNPRLVRGLDYYCHTTFEVVDTTHRGRQSAVLAGGRYDGLADTLGARPAASAGGGAAPGAERGVPAVGWAAGVDRLVLMREALGVADDPPPWRVAVITVRGKGAAEGVTALGREALRVAADLRRRMLGATPGPMETAVVVYNQGNTTRQLAAAAKSGCAAAVVVGEDEASRGAVALKDMRTGEQAEVPAGELLDAVLHMHTRHAMEAAVLSME